MTPSTTDIYTLSLHDALPIWLMFQLDRHKPAASVLWPETKGLSLRVLSDNPFVDRKSTCLNSSHRTISYAVFCLKKKKKKKKINKKCKNINCKLKSISQ